MTTRRVLVTLFVLVVLAASVAAIYNASIYNSQPLKTQVLDNRAGPVPSRSIDETADDNDVVCPNGQECGP